MTTVEEVRAQLDRLKARVKEYQAALHEAGTAQEKADIKGKIATCRTAIRDVQVQLDHLDPPEQRKARKAQRKKLDIGAMSFDFFEKNNVVWSDIEGHTWNQVEAGDFVEVGASMEQLQSWMAEGSQQLTDRQRLYLDAYYNDGLSLEAIGKLYGVDKSTVSRVIHNGLARMQNWVDAKKLIRSCAAPSGRFDWKRYLEQVQVLTARQKQLLLLALTKLPKTQQELAEKLEIERSTVSRTLARAGRTVRRLAVRGGEPTSVPQIWNWEQADKFSLAIQTGMPLHFYYRYCFRGQKVGGVSRYIYEISRRREAGEPPEAVAEELGLKVRTVRGLYGKLKRDGVQVGHIPLPEANSIAAHLDPETYVKLQRMVTARAGP